MNLVLAGNFPMSEFDYISPLVELNLDRAIEVLLSFKAEKALKKFV